MLALVDLRLSQGITQRELSRSLGWPQSRLAQIERGHRRLGVVEFVDLVLALDGDPGAFLRQVLSRE